MCFTSTVGSIMYHWQYTMLIICKSKSRKHMSSSYHKRFKSEPLSSQATSHPLARVFTIVATLSFTYKGFGSRGYITLGWLDYQKACGFVLHYWILETIKISGIANNANRIIEKSMRTYNTRLEHFGINLSHVCIKRELLQGDSLSPLLFITPLNSLSVIPREAVQNCRF